MNTTATTAPAADTMRWILLDNETGARHTTTRIEHTDDWVSFTDSEGNFVGGFRGEQKVNSKGRKVATWTVMDAEGNTKRAASQVKAMATLAAAMTARS